jgi:biotin transport system substrate-specific component
MILVALFAGLMAIGAMLKILFPVVPLSFQPFFCAFAGILLGSRLGLYSQLIYIAIGLTGAPVFTNGGGITYVLQPSFGYLIGFAVAAYTIGKISEVLGRKTFPSILVSVLSGLVVIYAFGIPYVYMILNFYLRKSNYTWGYALSTSIPLFLKDIVLYIVVAIVVHKTLPALIKSGWKHPSKINL